MKKILIVSLLTAFAFSACNTEVDSQLPSALDENLTPVEKISHAHGLAVDIKDPGKLYIATHYGLYLLKDEKNLFQIGEASDDYMGFTTHPTNSLIFYSSGHSSKGGNLGVQKSEDGGVIWKKISEGINGPVDFHAMTISTVNPDILYGWYGNTLQRSDDGGENYEILPSSPEAVISLTTHPTDENIIFAGTANGLFVSKDKGLNWESFSAELSNTTVMKMAIDPNNEQNLISSSEKLGLAYSNDGGKTWQQSTGDMSEDILTQIDFEKQNSQNLYAIGVSNSIYKSDDSGKTWKKIF